MVFLLVMPWHVLSVLKVGTLLFDAAFSGGDRAVGQDALFGAIRHLKLGIHCRDGNCHSTREGHAGMRLAFQLF